MADLVERLQHAACTAIAEQRRDLERAPHELRSLHLEIELRQQGAAFSIREARSFVERHISTDRILGVRGR
jgi:hypothetical protein